MPRCSIVVAAIVALSGVISVIAADKPQTITWELAPLSSRKTSEPAPQKTPKLPTFDTKPLPEQPVSHKPSRFQQQPARGPKPAAPATPQPMRSRWTGHSGSATAPTLISYRTMRRSPNGSKTAVSGRGWAKSSQTTPFEKQAYAKPGEQYIVAKPVRKPEPQPVVARVVERRRIRNAIPSPPTAKSIAGLPQFDLTPMGPVKPQVSMTFAKTDPVTTAPSKITPSKVAPSTTAPSSMTPSSIVAAKTVPMKPVEPTKTRTARPKIPVHFVSRSKVVPAKPTVTSAPVRTPQVVLELKPDTDSNESGKVHIVRHGNREDVKDDDTGYVILQLEPLTNQQFEQPLVFNMTSQDLGPAPGDKSDDNDTDADVPGPDASAADAVARSPKLVGSTRPQIPVLDFVPINQVQIMSAVHAPPSESPKYDEPDDLAELINEQYAPIYNWGAPQWYTFKPSRNTFPFKHNPLYFEDPNLERCGQSKGCLTTLASAVQFFSTVPQLPFRVMEQAPRDCVCARPDCPTCHEFNDAP